LLAGRPATVLGDPDQPHTYTFIPDIGEGLAVLGEHPAAAGRIWHLPNDPVTRTTRQLAELACPGARVRPVRPMLLRLAGLTDPAVREILEMRYLFEEPFVVDSSAIAAELGVTATPAAEALAETSATYRVVAARLPGNG
jgi:nucleoside-diphosphate-sugar epimerase